MSRSRMFLFPTLVLGALAACSEVPPTATLDPVSLAKGGRTGCNAFVPLSITLADAAGDAVFSDGLGAYIEGVDGVGAHTSNVNGNLMLTVQQSATRRIGWVSTAGTGLSDDRLYTNTHDNPGGDNACGLAGMANGSSGTAAFEFELLAGSTNSKKIIRYGKSCSGSAVSSERVTTTLSADGTTWTITGASGVHCDNGAKNKMVQVGTAGPFSMTLVKSD